MKKLLGAILHQAFSAPPFDARRRRAAVVVAAWLAAAFIASPAAARQADPVATIERLHSVLIEVMRQADALGLNGRYNSLAPTIIDSFNLPLMAQTTVGGYWKSLTPEQQARLVDVFSRLTLVTYAARFDGYSGERFETVAQNQTARSIVVRTVLVKGDGERIRLDYLMRQFDDRWQIIDVLAKGAYSELATRRSEYTAVLRREGFEALITKLDDKVAELAQAAAR